MPVKPPEPPAMQPRPLPLPPNAGPTIETIAALDAAIITATSAFGDLTPDERNEFLKSDYLGAPKLLRAVRSALAANGVLITSALRVQGTGFVCTTTLAHVTGGWRSSDWPILDMSKDQGVAIGAGWGLRQNLLQLLSISPSDVGATAPAAVVVPPQQPPVAAWQPPAAPAAPGGPTLPGEPPPWAPPAPVQQPPSEFI